ncbi:hypothetical protein VNO77_02549 [Canavalia gladiata]|uniref:Uncharacterized protein n=1 Tax=Canavalia gladiata TaxID=3824 RepID=A0AAN9R7C0_CANGL
MLGGAVLSRMWVLKLMPYHRGISFLDRFEKDLMARVRPSFNSDFLAQLTGAISRDYGGNKPIGPSCGMVMAWEMEERKGRKLITPGNR